MNTKETLETIKKQAEEHKSVYTATIWQDRRVYINFIGFEKSFAGDRNFKVFYDIKTGWNVEKGKGTLSSNFINNATTFIEDFEIDF